MKWEPSQGFIPRGWIGGIGKIHEIRLVFVVAEPNSPMGEEEDKYVGNISSQNIMTLYHDVAMLALMDGKTKQISRNEKKMKSRFHSRMLDILQMFWAPQAEFAEILTRTWITPAVLCSEARNLKNGNSKVEKACAKIYLKKQLDILREHAFIVALGEKARNRLRASQIQYDIDAPHPSVRRNAHKEWRLAARQFHAWLTMPANALAPHARCCEGVLPECLDRAISLPEELH